MLKITKSRYSTVHNNVLEENHEMQVNKKIIIILQKLQRIKNNKPLLQVSAHSFHPCSTAGAL